MQPDKYQNPLGRERKTAWFWSLIAALGVVWVGLMGFSSAQSEKAAGIASPGESGKSSAALPPLKVDRQTAPRLEELPDVRPSKAQEPKKPADNSACYVCHGNYDGEPLAQVHAEAKVGCMDCHGQSLGHRNAEDHLTPPDRMYPPDRIDTACQACHDTHDVPAKKVLARWRQKAPSKTDPEQVVCTDCHGDHRLARREILWDKRTGKLLPSKPAQQADPKP